MLIFYILILFGIPLIYDNIPKRSDFITKCFILFQIYFTNQTMIFLLYNLTMWEYLISVIFLTVILLIHRSNGVNLFIQSIRKNTYIWLALTLLIPFIVMSLIRNHYDTYTIGTIFFSIRESMIILVVIALISLINLMRMFYLWYHGQYQFLLVSFLMLITKTVIQFIFL